MLLSLLFVRGSFWAVKYVLCSRERESHEEEDPKFDNSACFHHRFFRSLARSTNRNGSKSNLQFYIFNFASSSRSPSHGSSFIVFLCELYECSERVREMGNDDRAMMMLMMIITMDWCLLFVEIFALFFGSLDIELQSMRNLFYF